MTVLSSELQVGTARAVLPRVNLLPPEIAEKAALRRLQLALGAVGVGALAVVGMLYVSATHSVSSANSELATTKSETTKLQADVNKFRDVTAIYNAADAAQSQMVQAMADEVRYSQMLNDLSLTIPSGAWFSKLTFTQNVPGKTTNGGRPTTGTAATPVVLPPATLAVEGKGFKHDDVAAWLDAIAGLKTYTNPYFSLSEEKLADGKVLVHFQATAELTQQARSGRYTRPQGG